MSVLKEIMQSRREALAWKKSTVPLADLKARARDREAGAPFGKALKRKRGERIRLIAELKKASPSEGVIREEFNVDEILSIYTKKGVDAVSVLTEERFFQGSLDYLERARQLTRLPLLRKDFIFDDYQLYESKAHGASALLLIAASLDRYQLADLLGLSAELSLECLVEVHSLKELERALRCSAEIIGINNRDLNTLKTSLNITCDLVHDIPESKVVISESGIHTRADVASLESRSVDAILVGTTIMKSPDIGKKIDELRG